MGNGTPPDPEAATTTTSVSHAPPTLLVGSQQDEASCAMMSALLARGDWLETTPGMESNVQHQLGRAWTHERRAVSLWSVEGPLLGLDDADRRWTDIKDVRRRSPADVIFLSKHVAKSGVPALCVHPIGVPDVSDEHPPRFEMHVLQCILLDKYHHLR